MFMVKSPDVEDLPYVLRFILLQEFHLKGM
ncbi:hypothetical protein J2Z65_007088 [Paenibacillus aceris]|uniref:GNAT family N-acetyltransferase n=1 Tax=Paenibacillus aceris TaxID=869555 RepID=A0ABS4IBR5_9BACL|nr:hypothetical protein [Paenibacillus aceris]